MYDRIARPSIGAIGLEAHVGLSSCVLIHLSAAQYLLARRKLTTPIGRFSAGRKLLVLPHADRRAIQRAIPIVYKGIPLDTTYRVDLIVEEVVVVETNSVFALLKVHEAQVLTYMKLTDCPAGLLINFNVPKLMDGVKRLVLRGR